MTGLSDASKKNPGFLTYIVASNSINAISLWWSCGTVLSLFDLQISSAPSGSYSFFFCAYEHLFKEQNISSGRSNESGWQHSPWWRLGNVGPRSLADLRIRGSGRVVEESCGWLVLFLLLLQVLAVLFFVCVYLLPQVKMEIVVGSLYEWQEILVLSATGRQREGKNNASVHLI